MKMESQTQGMSLQRLLDEPKGKIKYHHDQAFLLHVFWEAPNATAAEKVLDALRRCAEATHRDTPCVPTYYFRISCLDADLASASPTTVGQHLQLREAQRKLKVGVPRPAILADLKHRGIDPGLLDAAEDTLLSQSLQQAPVMLECTELYLDGRSFYEHAGSRDYLKAYGEVMSPGLKNSQATVRVGTPTTEIADKILAPMLKEIVEPLQTNCRLWQQQSETHPEHAVLISLDVEGSAEEISRGLPATLRNGSTTCVAFNHPLRKGRVRVVCILPELPSLEMLQAISALPLRGIEMHCDESDRSEVESRIVLAKVGAYCAVKAKQAGYLLHNRARDVLPESSDVMTEG